LIEKNSIVLLGNVKKMGTFELKKFVNHNNESLLYIQSIGLSCIKTNSSVFQYSVKCYYKTIKNSKIIFAKISRKPFDISVSVFTERTLFSSASKIVTFTFNSHNRIQHNQKLFLNFQIFNKTKHIICDQCILIFPKVNLLSSKDSKTQTDKDQIEKCINKIDKINTFYDDIQKNCDNFLEEHSSSIEKDDRQLRNLITTFKEYIESNNKVIEKINQFYDNMNDGNFLKELIFEKLNLQERDLKFIRSIDPKIIDILTEIEKLSEKVSKYKKQFENFEQTDHLLNIDNVDRKYEY